MHKAAFNNASADQRFQLHFPLHEGHALLHAPHQPYRITLDDGRVIAGTTDANGLTDLIKDDAMRIVKIDLFNSSI